jgi:hypothetical protein
MFTKRCHNQAKKGLGRLKKAWEGLERIDYCRPLTNYDGAYPCRHLHMNTLWRRYRDRNQAVKGQRERPNPTGTSLACQEPPRVAPDRQG